MHQYYDLLSVKVQALTMQDLNNYMQDSIAANDKIIIANHNLHSIFLFRQNLEMQNFYKGSHYVHIDGMPIVFLGKLLGYPFAREHRTTYADWIWSIAEEACRNNWKIFYLGSKPDVAEQGAEKLMQKFSDLKIAVRHGYFDITKESEENQKVVEAINQYRPHILMVGMGMPRQETWISCNYKSLKTNVILPSGAAIDYVAGAVPTPPRWAGRVGLEWFFRFVAEPKRLAQRYFVEPFFVLYLFLFDIVSKIRFSPR